MNTTKTHPQLLQILQTKRAHNSVGDYLFRAWLLDHLAPHTPRIEGEGNIVVKLGESRVAFSCHVDTCHSQQESDGSFQNVVEDMGLLKLGSDSRCLGADDGIGIFFMLQLLESRVPGTYIFHTGEECGAEGSLSINSECRAFTKTFDLIVAFDRAVLPGQQPEVVITQSGTPCASEVCGQAVADALNAAEPSLGFVVSHRGVFTDTLNYAENVAECLNVGCFYADQHSPAEFVDVEKVNTLLRAVLSIAWDSLPVVRKAELEFSGGWNLQVSASEAELYSALHDVKHGDYNALFGLLSKVGGNAYSLDADEVKHYLRPSKVTTEMLGTAMDDLNKGDDPELILLDMLDEITR